MLKLACGFLSCYFQLSCVICLVSCLCGPHVNKWEINDKFYIHEKGLIPLPLNDKTYVKKSVSGLNSNMDQIYSFGFVQQNTSMTNRLRENLAHKTFICFSLCSDEECSPLWLAKITGTTIWFVWIPNGAKISDLTGSQVAKTLGTYESRLTRSLTQQCAFPEIKKTDSRWDLPLR